MRPPMRFPEEVVASTVLPTFRVLLTRDLLLQGLTEAQVAALLGVSQAAVSKYRLGRIRTSTEIAGDPRVRATLGSLAGDLAEGRTSSFEALARLMTLIRELENRGPVCTLHEVAMPALDGLGCDLCLTIESSAILEEQEVLGALRTGLVALEDLEGFPRLIPNVGSNLGMARSGAADLSDVAAVPGRIYRLRGAVKVPAPPEFGASHHVAEVILAVVAYEAPRRAALNIRWDEGLLEAAEAADLVSLEMAPGYEGRREEIARALDEGGVPDLLFHRGDFGIEPITYILGEDPLECVGVARRLLQAYPPT